MKVIGSIIGCIIYVSWIILFLMNMHSNHKNEKSNAELLKEIHKSNDLNDKLLKVVKTYCLSTDKKATAQDNLMWESIMILARRIHNLEDQNYVK